MIETQAPGKLFIAGEYAVVTPGEPAVLVAVDRCIRVRLEDLGLVTQTDDGDFLDGLSEHVRSAIDTFEQLRGALRIAPRRYALAIQSELENEHRVKYGLGSSAAVTVAVIDALNRLYATALSKTQRFRLALLATISVSPLASGGDLAASTFGGWLRYTAPDRTLLRSVHDAEGIQAAMNSRAWDICTTDRLSAPQGLMLLVGWTGSPASTTKLVEGVAGAAGNQLDADARHSQFLAESRDCVNELVSGLATDPAVAQAAISRARALLQRLGDETAILIETERLGLLCDIAERFGAAAKPSGAGGGDCGIVLADSSCNALDLQHEWRKHGILPLELAIYEAEGGTHDN